MYVFSKLIEKKCFNLKHHIKISKYLLSSFFAQHESSDFSWKYELLNWHTFIVLIAIQICVKCFISEMDSPCVKRMKVNRLLQMNNLLDSGKIPQVEFAQRSDLPVIYNVWSIFMWYWTEIYIVLISGEYTTNKFDSDCVSNVAVILFYKSNLRKITHT